MNHDFPIFLDPERRRWKWVRLGMIAVGVMTVAIGAVLISSVVLQPNLPILELNLNHRVFGQHSQAVANMPQVTDEKTEIKPKKTFVRSTNLKSASRVIGFYVNWDDNSFTSLKQNIASLDVLMPEWLHLSEQTVKSDDLVKQTKALELIRRIRPNLKIDVLINNYNSTTQDWDSAGLAKTLISAASRKGVIDQLQTFLELYKLNGVNIDFENVPDAAQGNLVKFMQQLYARFHPLKFEVTESVPLDDTMFQYKALAAASDQLVLMGYDEHEDSSQAGAVASQSWLTDNIAERIAQIGANKIILGVGNYGYDWTVGGSKPVNELSFQDAQALARDSGSQINLGGKALNPTFWYNDEQNKTHVVWYLDAVSTFDQVLGTSKLGISSFALWRMGQEDPSVWNVFKQRAHLNLNAANSLRRLRYGYDLDYQGRGELLKATSLPHDGTRAVKFDATSGLILNEISSSFATPYTITRWGGNDPKKIAITFDDGPDPTFTPQVLEILKREHVPAAFFVIGANAEANPDVMRQIIAGGFEIGNHTFTHPNLSAVNPEQFKLELNATQRLLQSEFGISTLLFRPPYAEDVEPETPDQAGALVQAGKLGYYTVGMQIDPLDWHASNPNQIVQSILESASQHVGNVVLLHDAGGDRSATVAALPRVIHELRARGFKLVGLPELLGVSKAKLMPPVTTNRVFNGVSDLGFISLALGSSFLGWLFVGGIVLSVARLAFIAVLALLEARRKKPTFNGINPSLSVIVPAFNEAKVINKTIHSLLASSVILEVIVIDDGSKDNTSQVVSDEFGTNPRVKLFTLSNGGKARALNYGIKQANSEIVLLLDADTILASNAPELLLRHFQDARVAAVAGNAKVGNRINLLTRWQALEYITAQNLERRALARLGCITVVPGAIGAWRRTVITDLGGFTTDTLAEDADLTMRLLRMGFKISYEPLAYAYTEAPDTVNGFLKQRFRWMFGTLQAAFKQRDTLFQHRYQGLGWFAMPNVLVFQILFPFISSLMDVAMLMQLAWVGLQSRYHPSSNPFSSVSHSLIFYGVFIAVDALAAVVAFSLEPTEDWALLPWLFLQRFFYRQLMYFVAIKAAITAVRGSAVGWGSLERKATVQSAVQPVNAKIPVSSASV